MNHLTTQRTEIPHTGFCKINKGIEDGGLVGNKNENCVRIEMPHLTWV